MQLNGSIVLITGAGSGIGEALAIEASRRDMRVALMGRRAEALECTLGKLTGGPHLALRGDVTDACDRLDVLNTISRRWGTLTVLVNNAGLVTASALAAASDDDLKATINTNLFAPMAMARDALPLLKRYLPARIVNIGSVLGEIPYPLFAPYSASKAGLRGFSQALRRELAPLGIGVTHATLRATKTPASDALGPLGSRFNMTFDTPSAVATRVWDAVEHDADSVYPAGPERLFEFVQRLAPRLVDRSIVRQLTRIEPL